MREWMKEVATFLHFHLCCLVLDAEAGTRRSVTELTRTKVMTPAPVTIHQQQLSPVSAMVLCFTILASAWTCQQTACYLCFLIFSVLLSTFLNPTLSMLSQKEYILFIVFV